MTTHDLHAALLALLPWAFFAKMLVHLALFIVLWREGSETPLGRWIVWYFAAITAMSIVLTIAMAYIADGPKLASLSPYAWVLLISLDLFPWFVIITGTQVARWHRATPEPVIVDAGVALGALARSMPLVAADQDGIIRYTTPALDELIGATPDELFEQNITTLIPERYVPRHLVGLERFLVTGESRIVGSVITVPLRCRDGSEVAVDLAVNSTVIRGRVWLIGALWRHPVPELNNET